MGEGGCNDDGWVKARARVKVSVMYSHIASACTFHTYLFALHCGWSRRPALRDCRLEIQLIGEDGFKKVCDSASG